ncbi:MULTISPECIES: hypothetical protein [unclassified Streptomyces]|jgi:hypothetical protein|uniref:hypothetical protein n=1 Tax=unclassified Streptomyces TaxID=2593676 RepID=UPI002E263481
MRQTLAGPTAERVHLQGEHSGELPGADGLEATGVRVLMVPCAGRNIMVDNPDAFTAAVGGTG